MANKELKLSYSNAELYISKYNVYVSSLILLVGIVNDTMYSELTARKIKSLREEKYAYCS